MPQPQWNISARESDKALVMRWVARCSRLGVLPESSRPTAQGIMPALRLAIQLAESLPDHEVKRGYA